MGKSWQKQLTLYLNRDASHPHPCNLWETPSHPMIKRTRIITDAAWEDVLPQKPQILTDFFNILRTHIRVDLRNQWETPSHPMIKRTRMPRISRIQFEWCSPTYSTDFHRFFLLITDLSEFTEAAPLRYSEIWLVWCPATSANIGGYGVSP